LVINSIIDLKMSILISLIGIMFLVSGCVENLDAPDLSEGPNPEILILAKGSCFNKELANCDNVTGHVITTNGEIPYLCFWNSELNKCDGKLV